MVSPTGRCIVVSSTSHRYSVRDDRIGQLFVWYPSLKQGCIRQILAWYSRMARPDPLSLSEYSQNGERPVGRTECTAGRYGARRRLMRRVEGKVALITGAARGQGRSHAMRLAEEGANIIGLDLPPATAVNSTAYPMAGGDDFAETVRLVEERGRRILACSADVRDQAQVSAAVAAGIEEFGRVDIVGANASILGSGEFVWEIPDQRWEDTLDINVTGVWNTVRACAPHMIEADRGGAIVITSSTAGLSGTARTGAYTTSTHAVVGLMKT